MIDTINSLNGEINDLELPPCIVKNSQVITNKSEMLDCFNRHFISVGSMFNSGVPQTSPPVFPDSQVMVTQPFDFNHVTVSEVHSVINSLDYKKSAGHLDRLWPFGALLHHL